jgi:hypothetical protein
MPDKAVTGEPQMPVVPGESLAWWSSSYVDHTNLWVYETAADRWTEVKPATAPPPGNSATCYDASQDLLVLFNDKGQTWTCKIERVEQK